MTAQTAPAAPQSRLAHMPIAFFAVVMGLSGLALATGRAEVALGASPMTSRTILVLAVGAFLAIGLAYALKALRHPAAVAGEWHHPVRMAFFPAISISLILLATGLAEPVPAVALPLWAVGAGLHLLATLVVVSTWIGHRPFEPAQMTPAWFIPAVGNIIVPVAGARFGFVEVSWFFFSVGVVFWVILATLVFNRLVFHTPMPEKVLPTLMILVAPPAVGFLAYHRLEPEMDGFARLLMSAAILFALVVATQARRLVKVPFSMAWWAYSFPLAALTTALYVYAGEAASAVHLVLAHVMMAVTGLAIAGLVVRTLKAMASGEVFRPE